MTRAEDTLWTYEHATRVELVRPTVKFDNRAVAAAGLRFWAEAQNAGEKVSIDVELPSNDAVERFAEGYAA